MKSSGRNMQDIRRIPYSVAAPFIEKWHYSKRCPTGKNIFFGWYIKAGEYGIPEEDMMGDALYAVVDYGIGVNPYQAAFLSKLTGEKVEKNTLLEIKRLCRIEPKIESMPLTSFIAKCNKILSRDGFCFVVSFSDPAHGHNGGIYKASNFKHVGQTSAENHVAENDGTIRHRRLYFRHARRKGISVEQSRNDLGLRFVKTPPKDRWFIRIGKPKK